MINLLGGGKDPAKEARKRYEREAREILRGLSPAELEEYRLVAPELVGLLDAEEQGDTELANISLDPELMAIQRENLQRLLDESKGGFSAQERLMMEDAIGQSQAAEKAQRASIDQEMARRGTADAGSALASKLQAVQGGANARRRQALDLISQSSARRNMSANQAAQQSAGMEQADYGRQANLAQSRDAIAARDIINRQNVAAQNLSARQAIANQRTNTQNMNAQIPNQLSQQNWQNQAQLAQMRLGAAGNAAQFAAAEQPRGNFLQQAAGIGMTVAGMGGQNGFGWWGAENGGVFHAADGGVVPQMVDPRFANLPLEYQNRINVPQAQMQQMADIKRAEMQELRKAQAIHDAKLAQDRTITAQDMAEGDALLQEANKDAKSPYMKTKEEKKKKPSTARGFSKLLDAMNPKQERRDPVNLKEITADIQNILPVNSPQEYANPFAKTKPLEMEDGGTVIDEIIKNATERMMLDQQPQNFEGGGLVEDELGALMAQLQAINSQADNPMPPPAPPMPPQRAPQPPMMAQGGPPPQQGMPMPPQAMENGGTYRAQDGSLMFTSDGSGDIVEGDSFERDRVDARLNSGEAVLNVAQQQRLMDMLRGKISPEEMPDEDIVEGVPSDYQDGLLDEIDNGEKKEDIQARGFKNLLDMLGKK
jgi:hypothetical protein